MWLLAIAACIAHGEAQAQTQPQSWPTKRVTVVVPFTAGSATDIMARTVAQRLSEQLGQPFVVENRTGAGGTVGMGVVAKSAPDGHTILIHSAAHVIQPSTFPNIGFHAGRDFAGVTPLINVPLVLIASKYKTLKDLITAAKAKPNAVSYATVGYGAAAHLTAERLRLAAGFQAQQVPFRGAPEAVNEVLADRVDFYFSPLLAVLPLVRDRKLNALAVSSSKRAAALPDVPTTIEAGYPNSDYNFWIGMFVPAKTPRNIIDRLYEGTRKAMARKSVQDKLSALGGEPMSMAPAEWDKFLQSEIAMNAALVKAAGIKPNP
jgi:tripartite-type tricarboxylate transporter receptor subunit TctC